VELPRAQLLAHPGWPSPAARTLHDGRPVQRRLPAGPGRCWPPWIIIPGPAARCAADRRGGPGATTSSRRSCSNCWPSSAVHHPRTRPPGGAALPPVVGCSLPNRTPGSARRAEAALPLTTGSSTRTTERGRGDHPPPGAPPRPSHWPGRWPGASRGCGDLDLAKANPGWAEAISWAEALVVLGAEAHRTRRWRPQTRGRGAEVLRGPGRSSGAAGFAATASDGD